MKHQRDANVDPGVVDTISGALDVPVVGGQATGFNAQVGPITEQ